MRGLQTEFLNLVLVHGSIHASWLNQIEMYFSILQRKKHKPDDCQSLEHDEERLLVFQCNYESNAGQIEWQFTKKDCAALMQKTRQRKKSAKRK